MKTSWLIAGGLALAIAGAALAQPVKDSIARAFVYEEDVVELVVIGPAAKDIYDRLPGKGREQACGGAGLYKVREGLTCNKDGADYSCHLWLDPRKPALTAAQSDDC